MKIKKVSCTQFAGIRDCEYSFDSGINVVYGKNESGKSTLVNLISRTLFKDVRLDKRSDKEFFQLYFPAPKRGSAVVGDFADGAVTFESEKGTYTIKKEWGAQPRAVLSTPDGVLHDPQTIKEVLKEALRFGEGVYSDMLFTSQKDTAAALRKLLNSNESTDAKREFTNAVSVAFSEGEGLSTEAIEEAINAKIEAIEGKHWDKENGAPQRKVGRWQSGLGEILNAYYKLEDAKDVLSEISRLESAQISENERFSVADSQLKKAEEQYEKFSAFSGMLAVKVEREKEIKRLYTEKGKLEEVLSRWPKLEENTKKAVLLQKEFAERNTLDLYQKAKPLYESGKALKEALSERSYPEDAEISQVKAAQREVSSLSNKLLGMNLSANIKMLGNHSIIIKSLVTGEEIEVGENTPISEAVSITIPDVMEIALTPQNVDISLIEKQKAEMQEIIDRIFTKYKVSTLEELEKEVEKQRELQKEMLDIAAELRPLLVEMTFEELENKAKAVTSHPREREEILAEISKLCEVDQMPRFIVSNETILASYCEEYKSVENLKAKVLDKSGELKKAQETVSKLEEIPGEFLGIADPQAHLERLNEILNARRLQREEALTAKTQAESIAQSYKENIKGDPREELLKAEKEFLQKKELLDNWYHIKEVFLKRKEEVKDKPLEDVAKNFSRYLLLISGNRVDSQIPEADKLKMSIYSDDRLLDFEKLSEGTKETVSFAFRLAALDHLFPEGGGIAVFDDPFSDMDSFRAKKSAGLLAEFSKRHQVIFLTCREENIGLLGGNTIRI